MATNRYISTNFWKDNYVVDLDPSEKLLFIYFLTNPKTNIAGVYELNLREVAFDTGFDIEMVKKVMDRFQKDGKMFYADGWLVLRNWVKHQNLSPKIQSGIAAVFNSLPDNLRVFVNTDENGKVSIDYDRLSIDYTKPYKYLIKSNSIKLNINTSTNVLVRKAPGLKKITLEINEMFVYWEEKTGFAISSSLKDNRYACSSLIKKHGVDKVKQLIDGVALSHGDRFAPNISDFRGLRNDLGRLMVWGKKRQQSATSGGVGFVS